MRPQPVDQLSHHLSLNPTQLGPSPFLDPVCTCPDTRRCPVRSHPYSLSIHYTSSSCRTFICAQVPIPVCGLSQYPGSCPQKPLTLDLALVFGSPTRSLHPALPTSLISSCAQLHMHNFICTTTSMFTSDRLLPRKRRDCQSTNFWEVETRTVQIR